MMDTADTMRWGLHATTHTVIALVAITFLAMCVPPKRLDTASTPVVVAFQWCTAASFTLALLASTLSYATVPDSDGSHADVCRRWENRWACIGMLVLFSTVLCSVSFLILISVTSCALPPIIFFGACFVPCVVVFVTHRPVVVHAWLKRQGIA